MVYEHLCEACNHEWEDIYKLKDPVPDTCPSCNTKGQVKRLISWSAGRVELSGHEYQQHIKEEAQKLKREASQNENVMANLVGEDKYNKNQTKG